MCDYLEMEIMSLWILFLTFLREQVQLFLLLACVELLDLLLLVYRGFCFRI